MIADAKALIVYGANLEFVTPSGIPISADPETIAFFKKRAAEKMRELAIEVDERVSSGGTVLTPNLYPVRGN